MPIPTDTVVWRIYQGQHMVLQSPQSSGAIFRISSISLEVDPSVTHTEVTFLCRSVDEPKEPEPDAPQATLVRFGPNGPHTFSYALDLVFPGMNIFLQVRGAGSVAVIGTWYHYTAEMLAYRMPPIGPPVPSNDVMKLPSNDLTKTPANGTYKQQLPKRKLTEPTAEVDDDGRKRLRVHEVGTTAPTPPNPASNPNPAPASASTLDPAPANLERSGSDHHLRLTPTENPTPNVSMVTGATSFATATTSFDGNSRYPLVLPGGLRYRVVAAGDGVERPKPNELVRVKHQMYVDDKQVDKQKKFLFRVGTGQVIKGLDLLVSNMRIHETVEAIIPPALAWGDQGNPPIVPSNKAVTFIVSLREIGESATQPDAA
ncbi:hypothetical protein SISNIDRAFT_491974 [Sistotremastrum niveocremeum HHB9708]|uniref:peptidylprolyl isomerase n=1 Tax=Sistotremastrum niveocremeum HHB9708 TaxID=1314777 RepID=A0A164M6U5_9AGAM|nr:hypothetical protein SISNIDRAFT_491974 [Sistotremastrum niveocremeum HHB9708]